MGLSNWQRQQRAYMNSLGEEPAWIDAGSLTPLGHAMYFSTLHRCRALLPADLTAGSLLIVNGGWGVDTRFFELAGVPRVTVCDLSERMLAEARNRCDTNRYCASVTEQLPFSDNAFDYVGVRSGLHHLEDPWAGLAEMFRVARKGVFFLEGQRTPFVPALIAMGALEAVEEAGNAVFRFTRAEVCAHANTLGATETRIDTGWYFQIPVLLSIACRVPGRWPVPLYWAAVRVTNAIAGRWGNAFIAVLLKDPPVA